MPLYRLVQDVRILPISSLKLHEMTVREQTEKMKGLLLASHFLKNPVIVERKSRVVLDGTHRIAALSELGYKNALCQLVDYSSPDVKVGAWHPYFHTQNAFGAVAGITSCKEATYPEGMRLVKSSRAAFLLAYLEGRKKKFLAVGISAKPLPANVLAARQSLIARALSQKHRLRYVSDEHWQAMLAGEKAILVRRSFSKAEILSIAGSGRLLPPKATRHEIPVRILGANIPIGWLRFSAKEAEERLRRHLHLCIDAEEARYYPEPVLVLDDARAR